ncbi:Hypothetical protein POVN_LOCUS274 [uncultured virus]|nr:Hypothetical protein POVN_LOCUS274 [uncultured virus]
MAGIQTLSALAFRLSEVVKTRDKEELELLSDWIAKNGLHSLRDQILDELKELKKEEEQFKLELYFGIGSTVPSKVTSVAVNKRDTMKDVETRITTALGVEREDLSLNFIDKDGALIELGAPKDNFFALWEALGFPKIVVEPYNHTIRAYIDNAPSNEGVDAFTTVGQFRATMKEIYGKTHLHIGTTELKDDTQRLYALYNQLILEGVPGVQGLIVT